MFHRKTLGLLIILALGAGAAVAADYEAALGHFKSGKYVEAAAEFQALVDQSPEYDYGYFMLGQSFIQMNKLDDAEGAFIKAIELNGDKFEYHFGLATAYFKRKKFDKVIGTLRTAEALAPDSHKFHLYKLRGIAYAGLEKSSDAVADLEKARALKKDQAVTEKLGIAYYTLGHHDKSVPVLKEALASAPNNAPVLARLANALMDLGAETADSTKKTAYYAEAQQYADRYSNMKPGSFDAVNLAARAALGAKNYPEAERLFTRVIEIKPDYCYAMVNLGKVHIAQSKWGPAEEVLLRGSTCAPRMAVIWESLGFVNQKQKELEKAIEFYNKAMEIKPTDAIRGYIETCKANLQIAAENAAMAQAERESEEEARKAEEEYQREKAKQEEWERKRERDD